jgi:tRNA pseudouridine55 synthase
MPHPQPESELHGALLIDKPAGPTSHDIVDIVRNLFRIKKVGHCGTLDPAATGLLILLLGRATKLSQKLTADDKVYEGTMHFGQATDSYDAQGEVTDTAPVPPLDCDALNLAAREFTGDIQQKPPMVSAVKKDGVPLYKLARKGKTVEREAKPIHIYSYEFSEYTEPVARFRVHCTKGTYVRSLAHELGQRLDCGAHLSALHRSQSGKFSVADATRLEDLVKLPAEALPARMVSLLDIARMFLPATDE